VLIPSFRFSILSTLRNLDTEFEFAGNDDRELSEKEGRPDDSPPRHTRLQLFSAGQVLPVMPWISYFERPMRVDAPRQVGLKFPLNAGSLFCRPVPSVRGQEWPTARDGGMGRLDSMSNELLTNNTLEATEVLAAFPFWYMVIASSQAK
jgi:hypothetical protein